MNVLLLNATDAFSHDLIHKTTAAGYRVTATAPSLLSRTPPPPKSVTLPTTWRDVSCHHEPHTLAEVMHGQDVALLHFPNLHPYICPPHPTLLEDTIHAVRNTLRAARRAKLPRLLFIANTACLGTALEKPDELASWIPTPHTRDPWSETLYCAEREILAANSYHIDTCTLLTPTLLDPNPRVHQALHQLGTTYAETHADRSFAFLDYRDLARTALRAFKSARSGQRYALQGARATCTFLRDTLPPCEQHTSLRPDLIYTRAQSIPARIQPTKARGELNHKTRLFTSSVQEIFAA